MLQQLPDDKLPLILDYWATNTCLTRTRRKVDCAQVVSGFNLQEDYLVFTWQGSFSRSSFSWSKGYCQKPSAHVRYKPNGSLKLYLMWHLGDFLTDWTFPEYKITSFGGNIMFLVSALPYSPEIGLFKLCRMILHKFLAYSHIETFLVDIDINFYYI